jgi:hypothetical protein
VDPKSNFAKCSLSNKLDELVILQCGWRKFIVLLDELLHEFDKSISFLEDRLVNFGGTFHIYVG